MQKFLITSLLLTLSLGGVAQRKVEVVDTNLQEVKDEGLVLKRKVAIGRFTNETQYAKGVFYGWQF